MYFYLLFLQILQRYSNEGFPFLLRAFNIPKYLEDLTGLTKLMEDTKLLEVWKMYFISFDRMHRCHCISFTSIVDFS